MHYLNNEGPVLCLFLESDSDAPWEVTKVENITNVGQEMNSSSRTGNRGDMKEQEREMSVTGVLNPTACLHLGDVMLFTVNTHHYPQYDLWVRC